MSPVRQGENMELMEKNEIRIKRRKLSFPGPGLSGPGPGESFRCFCYLIIPL